MTQSPRKIRGLNMERVRQSLSMDEELMTEARRLQMERAKEIAMLSQMEGASKKDATDSLLERDDVDARNPQIDGAKIDECVPQKHDDKVVVSSLLYRPRANSIKVNDRLSRMQYMSQTEKAKVDTGVAQQTQEANVDTSVSQPDRAKGTMSVSQKEDETRVDTPVVSEGAKVDTTVVSQTDGAKVDIDTTVVSQIEGARVDIDNKIVYQTEGAKVDTDTTVVSQTDGAKVDTDTTVVSQTDGAKVDTDTTVVSQTDGAKVDIDTTVVSQTDGAKVDTDTTVVSQTDGAKVDIDTTAVSQTDGAKVDIDTIAMSQTEGTKVDVETKAFQIQEPAKVDANDNECTDAYPQGIAEARKIESGIIYTSIPETVTATHNQKFKSPYKFPPKVFVNVKYLNRKRPARENDYHISVSDVSTESFDINCETFHGAYVNDIEVHWISYPGYND